MYVCIWCNKQLVDGFCPRCKTDYNRSYEFVSMEPELEHRLLFLSEKHNRNFYEQKELIELQKYFGQNVDSDL